MNEKLRPAWIEINRDKLIHNFNEVKKAVGENIKICAVVKSDNYGIGAIEISKIYGELGVHMFAVAIMDEALDLRVEVKNKDILILGYTPEEFFEDVLNNDITLTIDEYEHALKLNETAKSLGKIANIHIKVETGMNRTGFLPIPQSIAEVVEISKLSNVKIQGIYTHFSCADETDKTYTCKQAKIFEKFIADLEEQKVFIPIRHAANSASIINLPEYYYDMVRPGLLLLGYYPSGCESRSKMQICPCVSLKAKVVNVKTLLKGESIGYNRAFCTDKVSVIGTLQLGYADGFSRLFSNKGYVVCKGVKCPVVGKVCMNQFMVDLTDVDNPKRGDEVIIYGDGTNEAMTADDAAHMLGTISHEILVTLGKRLPSKFV